MSTPEKSNDNYNPLGPHTTLYTIQRGDTLWQIANKTNKSVKEIAEINGITDINKIRVGQKLYLTQEAKDTAENAVVAIGNSQARAAAVRRAEAANENGDKPKSSEIPLHMQLDFLKYNWGDTDKARIEAMWFKLYLIQEYAPFGWGTPEERVDNYNAIYDQNPHNAEEQIKALWKQDALTTYRVEHAEWESRVYANKPTEPVTYMLPEEQNQFYNDNNIPSRVATDTPSTWWREKRV